MLGTVITRFAPSPTGFLHIGGARTALFNWLYARHHGGRMLLRIEDTDRERSTDAAIAAIIDGLEWLGLDWDGDTVFQFARASRHAEAARSLIASGNAYYCYASKEELDEMREAARREGRPMRYDGRWRDRDPKDAPAGVKPVIRLRAPVEGETTVDDMVQGHVTWQNKDLDDLVLLRSDGVPTYMLAVVVDDHDTGLTDIIRGDDHLTNAARQTQIYRAFGWDVPRMAHLPLIHGPDGAKLSKRHGALAGALRFRQAREYERHLYPRGEGRRPRPGDRAHPARGRPVARRTCGARASHAHAARRGHARAEGARQDARRADRGGLLSLCVAPTRARRKGEDAVDAGSTRGAR